MASGRVRQVAIGACAVIVLTAGPGTGGDWPQRFESEAPTAWDAYRQANRLAQGVYREEFEGLGLPLTRRAVEQKVNETCRLVRVTDHTAGTAEVLAENPQYSYRLKSGRGGDWVLTELHLANEAGTATAKELRWRIDMWRTAADSPVRFGLDGKLASEILAAPGTRVVAVEPDPQPAGLVEVRIETRPSSDDDRLRGGTLVLDPTRGWLPTRTAARITTKVATGTVTIEYEYGTGPNPPPRRITKREEYAVVGQAEPLRGTRTVEYEFQVPARLPDTREFTLAAFGLPEPVGVTWEKPTPRYVWFVLAAAGCGLLALALGRLARRGRTRATTAHTPEPEVPR